MIKVLLVDDEPNVRQGVKMMIPWQELGLEVIGEGEDGDDGLSKILELAPDIVIADVKMPGMTGIQMIDAAKKSGFNGKCLILSGYSDFTYAKEAMSLGVKQFILKPVDEDELIDALKALREEIAGDERNKITMEHGSEYMSEKLLQALLLGDDKVIESSELTAYDYDNYTAAIITASENMTAEEKNTVLITIKKRLEDESGADVTAPGFSGMTAALFKDKSRGKLMEYLSALSKEYSEQIFITVGGTVSEMTDIKRSYHEADELFKNRFRYLHRGIVSAETLSGDIYEGSETDEIIDRIYAYMEINDIDRLNEALERFRASLCGGSYTAERIKVTCITTVMEIKSRLVKNIGDKKTEQFLNDELIDKIGEKTSLFDIIELLKTTLTEISNTHFGRTTKSTMERVVQYIRSNYNSELRLEQLAAIFGYNRAYLGKVFHQYTGENFNNYLDSIRITEAKRLLEMDEYKVYEVAEMVGYTNINYFHNKFKKYVGISPLSYKRQSRGEAAGSYDDIDDIEILDGIDEQETEF
ncbi:MAG: response regulator transcription factor [Oscillospiraceae bacterium]|nr:response regulator transcription factor [Oscillospiraceae bacterium]